MNDTTIIIITTLAGALVGTLAGFAYGRDAGFSKGKAFGWQEGFFFRIETKKAARDKLGRFRSGTEAGSDARVIHCSRRS
jgi:hypothetical protein